MPPISPESASLRPPLTGSVRLRRSDLIGYQKSILRHLIVSSRQRSAATPSADSARASQLPVRLDPPRSPDVSRSSFRPGPCPPPHPATTAPLPRGPRSAPIRCRSLLRPAADHPPLRSLSFHCPHTRAAALPCLPPPRCSVRPHAAPLRPPVP